MPAQTPFDPRSFMGMFSRGRPVANGTTHAPNYKGGSVRGGFGNAIQRRLRGVEAPAQTGYPASPKNSGSIGQLTGGVQQQRRSMQQPQQSSPMLNQPQQVASQPQEQAAPQAVVPTSPPSIQDILASIQTPSIENPKLEGGRKYDAEFEAILRQLAGEQSRGISEANVGLQRLTQDFTRGVTDLDRQRQFSLEGLKNQFASSGLLRSGINVEEQGNVNEDFGRAIDLLSTGFSQSQEDIQRQSANLLSQIQEQLGIARVGATDRIKQKELEDALGEARLEAIRRELGLEDENRLSRSDAVSRIPSNIRRKYRIN